MGAGGVVEDVEAGGLGVRDLDAEDMEERVWYCGVGVVKGGGRFPTTVGLYLTFLPGSP